jgi:guanosine-3',5'-bis(diphosphate) 3'-pyrophosphohydrolase
MNNTQILFDALQFAAHKHRFQRRKGYEPIPYINHPIKVTSLLVDCGTDDIVVLTASILHDTLEDTDATALELTEKFGDEVCKLVVEMTDDMELPSDTRKLLQIEKADKLDVRTKLIKIADKASNIQDISTLPLDWTLQRKVDYLNWAAKVVEKCRGGNAALDAHFDKIFEEGMKRLLHR